MSKTLFTRIIEGEIPGDFVHRDDLCVVIRDINPQAPTHLLVIPIEPIVGVQAAEPSHAAMLGHLLVVARAVADAEGLGADGYRLVINAGDHGGQEVPHLHVHVLGGRPMRWPPG
jgi:histidine triad (HIT) family protein